MSTSKKTVLITGCSDGGMGAELAKEFHKAGLHVYATARDVSKMSSLEALGIEILPLDVQSETSIQACAEKILSLDILVNNAGASYTMPVMDLSLTEAKKLFDINVWGCIAVNQAFIPLLLKSSKPILAMHTSVGAGVTIPCQGTYNASKAAIASLTNTLRVELEPFNVTVVELRTGGVLTNFIQNVKAKQPKLPEKSIYSPARENVDGVLNGDWVDAMNIKTTAEQWAKGVVADLSRKSPPAVIWRGDGAYMAGWLGMLPSSWLDGYSKKVTGFDRIAEILRRR